MLNRIVTLLVIVLTLPTIQSKTKEALNYGASFVMEYKQFQEQDSITFYQNFTQVRDFYLEKNYLKALELGLKLKDKINKTEDIGLRFETTVLLGLIYEKNKNYREALKYYLKTEKLINVSIVDYSTFKLDDSRRAESFLKIGAIYQKLGLVDSAVVYYKKIESLNSLSFETLKFKANSYSNLAGVYESKSEFKEARKYLNKSLEIHKESGNTISQSIALNNLANIYIREKKYTTAKNIYLEGLKLIKGDLSEKAEKQRADLFYNLAWAKRNLNDITAYDDQEESYLLEDKLRESKYKAAIEEISKRYDVEKVKQEEEFKRKQIQEIEKIRTQQAQNITWIIAICSFFVIILLTFLLNHYKLRQKNLSLELARQELEQQQKIEKIKSESQSRILNATLDGKESERKQIAEILHDSVSALLSSASLHLQAFKSQRNGSTPEEIIKSQNIIKEASTKIRDLSHELVSSVLLKFGLDYSVNDIASKYSNSQISIITKTNDIHRYNLSFEMKINNIIQELVNNILKHSEATEAYLFIGDYEGMMKIEIRDNGKGFDKTIVGAKDGLGLSQIEARIEMMKGQFSINSKKGIGTNIIIEVPIVEKEESVIV